MNNYKLSRAWTLIHIDRFKNNIANIKNHLKKETLLMAVVKADAYGHGFYEIAKIAESSNADYLAVACIEEAKQIRRRGIRLPILILGATSLEAIPDLFEYDIIPTVFEEKLPTLISDYAKKVNKTLKIHIKIDTGMGRLGFSYMNPTDPTAKNTLETILSISRLKGIEIEGIFTHFSNADDPNGKEITHKQFDNFSDIVKKLEAGGIKIPLKHVANSAAICLYPEMQLSMVRAGLILYGEYPSKYVMENTKLAVKPVMEVKATVSQVKDLPANTGISYGKTFTTSEPTRVATINVGYADSYFRKLSNKARVLINGKFAPQIGNICMDQMLVNIEGIENVTYGTEVTLIGCDGENEITFSEISDIIGTINYEVMCDVGKRVVKAYFDDGKLTQVVNYLEKY